MNMALQLERSYPEVEKRDSGPQNVTGRLREWSRVRHYPSMNAWPPESPVYAVWKAPGRATDGAQDGGMAAMAERMENIIRINTRAREVAAAVCLLPRSCRDAIDAMYVVEKMERPRTERAVAVLLNVPKSEVQRRLNQAYGWLARDLCLPII